MINSFKNCKYVQLLSDCKLFVGIYHLNVKCIILNIAIFFTGSQNSKSSHTNPWEDAVPVQGQCLSGTLTCRLCLLLDMTLTGNLGTCFAVSCGGTIHQKKGFILMADKKEPFYQVLV